MTEDIQWNGTDIVLAADNDANTVSGRQRLEQGIGIFVSDEFDDDIGRVLSSQSITDITKSINEAVDRDSEIGQVQSVTITEINRDDNTVTVDAKLSQADDSTIVVNV
jgi:hypothetical protein